MPNTKGFRVAQIAKLYPTNCKMPAYNSKDTTMVIARDLFDALRLNAKKKAAIHNAHGPDLKKLADIFKTVTKKIDNNHTDEQRVDSSTRTHDTPQQEQQDPTPSTAPTKKENIAAQPTVHQRTTLRNNPFIPVLHP